MGIYVVVANQFEDFARHGHVLSYSTLLQALKAPGAIELKGSRIIAGQGLGRKEIQHAYRLAVDSGYGSEFEHWHMWSEASEDLSHKRIDQYVLEGRDRSAINTLFYEDFRDHRPEQLAEAIQDWYAQERARPGFFIQPALEALRAHQGNGTEVAFVSGSAVQFLAPLAAELDVTHVLANRLETRNERFTGQLIPPQTIGTGKWEAALGLMNQLGVVAANCYAYGDHLSDLALLMSVGSPTVVARDPALVRHAEQLGWPILWPAASAQGGTP